VSEWLTQNFWKEINENTDCYKWMKAMVELLSKNIPDAVLVFFSMSDDMWNFATGTLTEGGVTHNLLFPDGSFNIVALYATPRHIRSEACAAGMEECCGIL
jgi:hypothetical protein